ncbi:MAG: ATP-binding protein, partial [Propionicimonas sp.]|nr:ATP-binding protein [Propionicimonas sp.]
LGEQGIEALAMSVVVDRNRDGIEAAARTARYEALTAAARGEEIVLLGHTLDDQAESVLLGLARGSGTRSLAGMPARRGRFVRPFLGLRAEVTRQACEELGLTVWDDPENFAYRYARVRVRRKVMPKMEAELGPGVAEALARTARLARADADLLDGLAAAEFAARGGERLDVGWLADLPDALRHRVVKSWLAGQGGRDLSATHVWTVDALVTDWHGQGPVDLPGLRVRRRHDTLRAEPAA